ncbi:MAG: hypothetical protein Q9159_001997 [Coniocarpon cinnabarinum]
MASWAQVRTQTRQLEGQTETLLPQYGQLSTLSETPTSPTTNETSLADQVTTLLTRRATLLDQLADLRNTSTDPSEKQKRTGYHKLHEQKLTDHRQRFSHHQSQIQQKREYAQLMKGVHRDAVNYRAAQDPASAEADYMLEERGRIDRSNQGADSLLAQAYAVNEGMGLQREQLERIRRRALDVASMVPGVNGLIGRISIVFFIS